MRISHGLLVATLVLIPFMAAAQTAPSPEIAPVSTTGPSGGWIDFGARATSVRGDPARYERYRDLGDGAYLGGLRLNRVTNGWVVALGADNVGRRDQRFDGEFIRPGKFKGYAMWDQIPMLLSETTKTLFNEDLDKPQGVLSISYGLQSQ